MTTVISEQTSSKKIDDLIKKVPGAYKVAHDLVQECAIAIVEHAMNYGDCSRALSLARVVPINQARALIMYFMTVSPIGVLLSKDKKNDKVRLLKDSSPAYRPFDMDKAKALSWWTMDAEQAAKEAEQVLSGGVFDAILRILDKTIEGKDTATKEYTQEARETAANLKDVVLKFRAQSLAAKAASNDQGTQGLPVDTVAA